MTKYQFLAGMGLGMAAGAALGMTMSATKKRNIKRAADKPIKAVGGGGENISDSMGMCPVGKGPRSITPRGPFFVRLSEKTARLFTF